MGDSIMEDQDDLLIRKSSVMSQIEVNAKAASEDAGYNATCILPYKTTRKIRTWLASLCNVYVRSRRM